MTRKVYKIQHDLFEGVTLTVETRLDGVRNLGHFPTVRAAMRASRGEHLEEHDDHSIEYRRGPHGGRWFLNVREGDGEGRWHYCYATAPTREGLDLWLDEWRAEQKQNKGDTQTLNMFAS